MRNTIIILLAASAPICPVLAERILDQSFFNQHTHSLITFNTRGNGDEVTLSPGSFFPIPDDEYASLHIERVHGGAWARSGYQPFEDLIYEIASGPIFGLVANGPEHDPSYFKFDPPVRWFGTWVFWTAARDRPTFHAYDVDGNLIESAKFDKDAVDENRDGLEYGFLGISSQTPISYFTIPEGAAIDDLYYAPEPSAALLFLAGAGLIHRRR